MLGKDLLNTAGRIGADLARVGGATVASGHVIHSRGEVGAGLLSVISVVEREVGSVSAGDGDLPESAPPAPSVLEALVASRRAPTPTLAQRFSLSAALKLELCPFLTERSSNMRISPNRTSRLCRAGCLPMQCDLIS